MSNANITPDELRAAMKELGLSQTALAETLDIGRTMVHYYLKGTYPIPRSIGYAVRCLLMLHWAD